MKSLPEIVYVVVSLLVLSSAQAQDDAEAPVETLDLTMQLMPEGATVPEAVTRVIELPAAAAEAARENAARGLDQANDVRGVGDDGLSRADEAREQGSEQAQQARENAGRGRPEELGVPDSPGGPAGPPDDVPGPPESPGASGPAGN